MPRRSRTPGVKLVKKVRAGGAVTWYGRVRDPATGAEHQVNMTTLGLTTKEHRAAWAKKRSDELVGATRSAALGVARMTPKDAAAAYMADVKARLRKTTVQGYGSAVRAFVEWVSATRRYMNEITKADLWHYRSVVVRRAKEHSSATQQLTMLPERGPRQRVVAYLGNLDEGGRLGVKQAAQGQRSQRQKKLFPETEPFFVEVDAAHVRVENCRQLGGPWLGLELVRRLKLKEFLDRIMPVGREDVPWSAMALVLVLSLLCRPSSELYIAEHYYRQSALADLLGVPERRVNEQRLYRSLDVLLPHKEALEGHLKNRLGQLFKLEYDLWNDRCSLGKQSSSPRLQI